MTTTVTTSQTGPLTANGTTPLPFTFQAISKDEVGVTRNGVFQLGTYTTVLNANGTGSVIPNTSWGTDQVYIYSAPTFQQPTAFNKFGAFYPDQVNPALDRIARGAIALKRTAEEGLALAGTANATANGAAATANSAVALANSATTAGGNLISVKGFGAKGDGIANDTVALQTAAASGKGIYVPAGTYLVSGTINLSLDGASWHGDGISATIIRSTVANLPIFNINGSLNGVTITDMQLDRSVTATVGGDGIVASATIGQAKMERLLIQKQWRGVVLGPTDWSELERVIVHRCQSIGIHVQNTATNGTCQWSFDTVLVQMCGAQGFLVQAIAGPLQMTCGTLKNCATFGNTAVGLAFVGLPAVPVQGIRVFGGFFGESGTHEIFLDTYGDQHTLTGMFVELAGSGATGPLYGLTGQTPASGVGHGILVTANNTSVQMTGIHSYANAFDGFNVSAASNLITGCRAQNNGRAASAGQRNGVSSPAGKLVVSGGVLGNTGAGASQLYGVASTHGNVVIVGNDLTLNATAPTAVSSVTTETVILGNLPSTLNNYLSAPTFSNGLKILGQRQTGTAANATDLATALTLVNDLKAKLVAHGLVS